MEDAIDNHFSASIFIEDRIGKSSHQCSSVVQVCLCEEFRHPKNYLNTCVHTIEKLLPQAGTSVLIPTICFINVLLGFGRDYQFSGHSGF